MFYVLRGKVVSRSLLPQITRYQRHLLIYLKGMHLEREFYPRSDIRNDRIFVLNILSL